MSRSDSPGSQATIAPATGRCSATCRMRVRARKAPEPEPERDSGEIVHVHVKPGRTAVIGEKAFGDRATLQLARRDAAPPIESGDAEPVNPRRRPVASARLRNRLEQLMAHRQAHRRRTRRRMHFESSSP